MPPTREEMLELVQAHAELDEQMDTAIWIRRDNLEAWLVELLPSMMVDDHPERPVAFNPGRTFRHPLNLIASNMDGLRRAMSADHSLARDIAAGEILHGPERGRELQDLARAANGHTHAS
jgi:hypothetical protein